MALLEAMSYGCIPISTYVGGIPEVIDNEKNGFLIQAKDQEKLYTILKNIMNNGYDLPKMSKRARLSIENKYSLPNSIKKLYAFYQH
jgi:glycosyltransferase involved in cell wall biosynthesis